jgi:hypothetical protein
MVGCDELGVEVESELVRGEEEGGAEEENEGNERGKGEEEEEDGCSEVEKERDITDGGCGVGDEELFIEEVEEVEMMEVANVSSRVGLEESKEGIDMSGRKARHSLVRECRRKRALQILQRSRCTCAVQMGHSPLFIFLASALFNITSNSRTPSLQPVFCCCLEGKEGLGRRCSGN